MTRFERGELISVVVSRLVYGLRTRWKSKRSNSIGEVCIKSVPLGTPPESASTRPPYQTHPPNARVFWSIPLIELPAALGT